MRIRFLRSLTDAEVVAIAADAGVHQVPQPGTVYPKGSVWHVAPELGLALCTTEQRVPQPLPADAEAGAEPEVLNFGVAAEEHADDPAPDEVPAPDPAPTIAPSAPGWVTLNDQEG